MPDSRVFSLPIVVDLDVLEDLGFGAASGGVTVAVNQLNFQRVKEALGDRVIVAGRLAAHATAQFVGLNQPLVFM